MSTITSDFSVVMSNVIGSEHSRPIRISLPIPYYYESESGSLELGELIVKSTRSIDGKVEPIEVLIVNGSHGDIVSTRKDLLKSLKHTLNIEHSKNGQIEETVKTDRIYLVQLYKKVRQIVFKSKLSLEEKETLSKFKQEFKAVTDSEHEAGYRYIGNDFFTWLDNNTK